MSWRKFIFGWSESHIDIYLICLGNGCQGKIKSQGNKGMSNTTEQGHEKVGIMQFFRHTEDRDQLQGETISNLIALEKQKSTAKKCRKEMIPILHAIPYCGAFGCPHCSHQ